MEVARTQEQCAQCFRARKILRKACRWQGRTLKRSTLTLKMTLLSRVGAQRETYHSTCTCGMNRGLTPAIGANLTLMQRYFTPTRPRASRFWSRPTLPTLRNLAG